MPEYFYTAERLHNAQRTSTMNSLKTKTLHVKKVHRIVHNMNSLSILTISSTEYFDQICQPEVMSTDFHSNIFNVCKLNFMLNYN